ncbi:MAG: hypothetical protein A2270_01325 [Elusimicrobia bacterium RIFOXYA12_FULL_51_18]|nr:MAG: hypothetical protein A2270_01325 [Elusimicrobia bacterium RIFOXYA12_FULL_51_18]OGS30028.1 MAG: hypothetical protein A2218_12820 [Elusimicrobia bacterium RIFOXYA2_FULL_53_38]
MPKFIDYYSILGVPKSASEAEIKSAYRKLAMKHHPDRNPGNRESENKFKEINEANEVLSDPKKRQTYDQLGDDWRQGRNFTTPPGGGPRGGGFESRPRGGGGQGFEQFGDFSDFFRSIFGGMGGASYGRSGGEDDFESFTRGVGQSTPGDMESELHLSLSDVIRGGQQRLTFSYKSICPECGGKGRQKARACAPCKGTGHSLETREIRVNLPKVLRDGTRIRLTGQGRRSPSGRNGDLYLSIYITPHTDFKIEGDDLETRIHVMPWDAALGAEISIPAPDGPVKIKLPAGSGAGRRLRIAGKGLPKKDGSRGDLYAILTIDIPPSPTPRQLDLFRKLKEVS